MSVLEVERKFAVPPGFVVLELARLGCRIWRDEIGKALGVGRTTLYRHLDRTAVGTNRTAVTRPAAATPAAVS